MDGEFICKIVMLDHLAPLGEPKKKNKNKNHFFIVLC